MNVDLWKWKSPICSEKSGAAKKHILVMWRLRPGAEVQWSKSNVKLKSCIPEQEEHLPEKWGEQMIHSALKRRARLYTLSGFDVN